MQLVLRAAVIWEPTIHLIHPTRFFAAVEFVQIIDAFDIVRAIQRGERVLKLNICRLAHSRQHIEHRVTFLKRHGRRCQNRAIRGDIPFFSRRQIAHIVQDGVAANLNRAGRQRLPRRATRFRIARNQAGVNRFLLRLLALGNALVNNLLQLIKRVIALCSVFTERLNGFDRFILK